MAAGCAVSHSAQLRAPPVPGPFAAAGRAVRCRGRTFDPDRPRRAALRAVGRPAGLDRTGSRPRPPHPPPVPRPARGRAEHRRRLRRRHQRTTAPTAQPRPRVVVHDHDQPQPGNTVPAHAVTVRNGTGRRESRRPLSEPSPYQRTRTPDHDHEDIWPAESVVGSVAAVQAQHRDPDQPGLRSPSWLGARPTKTRAPDGVPASPLRQIATNEVRGVNSGDFPLRITFQYQLGSPRGTKLMSS
jgi:hypothetical protein